MKRFIKILFLASVYFAVSACTTTTTSGLACGPCSKIAPAEISGVKDKALKGDVKSARALINYYAFEENNPKEYAYWLKVGADLGDEAAQHDLELLTNESDSLIFRIPKPNN